MYGEKKKCKCWPLRLFTDLLFIRGGFLSLIFLSLSLQVTYLDLFLVKTLEDFRELRVISGRILAPGVPRRD